MNNNTEGVSTKSDVNNIFGEFYSIIKRLRGDGGCEWDRAQTPSSMKEHILEETYEVIDAIEEETVSHTQTNAQHVKEELGDVLLNVCMITYMYEQKGLFSLSDVLLALNEKLIRRHPHVFGSDAKQGKTLSADEVLSQWKQIKKDVEKRDEKTSILDGIRHLSPLLDAVTLKKKASKVGFDWATPEGVLEKLDEEVQEIKDAIKEKDAEHIQEEIGDAFFVLSILADKLEINPELALNTANKKFERRFRSVEEKMKDAKLELKAENVDKMNEFWEATKQEE